MNISVCVAITLQRKKNVGEKRNIDQQKISFLEKEKFVFIENF